MSFEPTTTLHVTLNGLSTTREIHDRELMVTFLRDDMGLTGTHIGCDSTNCGCCSILLDGRVVKSCTLLAAQTEQRSVTTIEGISTNGMMTRLQEAFIEEHALQCGYCTPGMIMCAIDLLERVREPTEQQIRAALAGNLCRCTGYSPIVRAIQKASKQSDDERV